MPGDIKSWTRVFDIHELVQEILPFLDFKSICAIRLLDKSFRDHCAPFFSITLSLSNYDRYLYLESVLTTEDTATAAAHEANQKQSVKNNRCIIYQIRGLHLSYEYDMRRRLLIFLPSGIVGSILNRCLNLRQIKVEDVAGDIVMPARSLRSDHDHQQSISPVPDGWPMLTHQYFHQHGYWNLWDVLPLENPTLLSRLESLALETKLTTPAYLNNFLRRLSHSSVTKTLKSLEIVILYVGTARTASWEILRVCICNMRVLEKLRLEGLKITPSDINANLSEYPDQQYQQQQTELTSWVAPKVKSFTFRFVPETDLKLEIIALFPNLENLAMATLYDLCDETVDQQIFSSTGGGGHPSSSPSRPALLPIPFPSLQTLDLKSTRMVEDWPESQLLESWIQRRKPNVFLLGTLSLVAHSPARRLVNDQIFSKLCNWPTVRFQRLQIAGADQEWVQRSLILTSTPCQDLEEIDFKYTRMDFVEILRSATTSPVTAAAAVSKCPPGNHDVAGNLSQQPSLPELNQQLDLFRILPPWAKTLTRLALKSPALDSRLDGTHGDGTLVFMRSMIRMLPRLVDLEIQDWMQDLTLFDGLGRPWSAPGSSSSLSSIPSSSTYKVEDPAGTSPLFPSLENYCTTYQPALRRLCLGQSRECWDQYNAWRERLQSQFRLLEELCINRQEER